MEHALNLPGTGENERFLILVWLGDAYQELGKSSRSEEYLEEARGIYPDSPLLVWERRWEDQ